MLISHKYKFIYLKTIKTASTSVEAYFERFCMPENDYELSHDREVYESNFGVWDTGAPNPVLKKNGITTCPRTR